MNLKSLKKNPSLRDSLTTPQNMPEMPTARSEFNSLKFTVDKKESFLSNPLIKNKKKKWKKLTLSILLVFMIIATAIFGYFGYYYYQNLNTLKATGVENVGIFDPINQAIGAVTNKKAESLSKLDRTDDRTNFLLLGVDARRGFSSYRTDSIIVASYSHKTKDVVEFSIPRDTQATYNKSSVTKINAIFQFTYNDAKSKGSNDEDAVKKGFTALTNAVNEVTGLKVHYGVMVNFTALKDIVDALGGITVNVDKDLYDAAFPNDSDTGHVVVNIKAGTQNMNGTKALQYARSRHSTNDYDRARRQQIVVNAIKEKFVKSNFFTDLNALNKVIEAISKNVRFYNVNTEVIGDVIASREILSSITTASVVLDPNIGATTNQVLRGGEPISGAGFLVYPVSGKYDDLKEIVQTYLKYPGLLTEDALVRVAYTNTTRLKDFNAIVKEIRDEQKQPFVYYNGVIKIAEVKPPTTSTPTSSPTASTEKKVTIYSKVDSSNITSKPKTLAYYQEILTKLGFTIEFKNDNDLPKELTNIYKDAHILIVVH